MEIWKKEEGRRPSGHLSPEAGGIIKSIHNSNTATGTPFCLQAQQAQWQSRRHGKDDRIISPRIILNHPVDFVTKDDLQGNVPKLTKSLPNGRQQGAWGRRASRAAPMRLVVVHLAIISLVLVHFLVNHP